jgi:hypothetical protein
MVLNLTKNEFDAFNEQASQELAKTHHKSVNKFVLNYHGLASLLI